MAIRAQAAIGEGELGAAIAELTEAAELIVHSNYESEGAHWMGQAAYLQALTGQTEAAIESARRGIEIDSHWTQIYFDLGTLHLLKGDFAGARDTLADLGRINQELVTPAGRFWESLLRTEIEREDENLDLAAEAMNQVDAMAPDYRWAHFEHLVRARLLAASGDIAGAIGAYRAAIDPRTWEGWPSVATRIAALQELARLEEEIGDLDNARRHYEEYLGHWGDADPAVIAVPEAKARFAALGG